MSDKEHGTEVEVLPMEARRGLTWWRGNPMLPASYRKKNGEVDVAGMERSAWLLVRLGIPVVEALGDTFVIFDQVGFKADLQRAVLTRPGTGYDFEVLELDDEHVVARVATPTGWKAPLTKRMTDTDMKTWREKNKANYDEKPSRMLLARVTTLLIDTYAKGVIRGWVAEAGVRYADSEDGNAPPESRDDGSTIPEPLRQPECDPDLRAGLIERLAVLEERQPELLRVLGEQIRPARIPNLRNSGSEFRQAHGWLLDLLFARLEGGVPAVLWPIVPEQDAKVPPPQEADAPESPWGDEGPSEKEYDETDPERPFEESE